MGAEVWQAVTELAQQEFAARGYRSWGRGFYSTEINPETVGIVALSKADDSGRWPDVWIRPHIGVSNLHIEGLLDEIMGEAWRQNRGGGRHGTDDRDGVEFPYEWTISAPLDEIKSKTRYYAYHFREDRDHAPLLHRMLDSIEQHGRPFMDAHASLEALAEALTDPHRTPVPSSQYRAPIAYYLLGDAVTARALLDRAMERMSAAANASPSDPDADPFIIAARQSGARVDIVRVPEQPFHPIGGLLARLWTRIMRQPTSGRAPGLEEDQALDQYRHFAAELSRRIDRSESPT
jgi:hypothetical protein